tara:strand:- start:43386 stop:43631 length:246 start_codon:yes stop_codon:yes gene_type:complete
MPTAREEFRTAYRMVREVADGRELCLSAQEYRDWEAEMRQVKAKEPRAMSCLMSLLHDDPLIKARQTRANRADARRPGLLF